MPHAQRDADRVVPLPGDGTIVKLRDLVSTRQIETAEQIEQLVNSTVVPHSSSLRGYFSSARKANLLGPEACVGALSELKCDKNFDAFVVAARKLEASKSFFECPDAILGRIFESIK